MENTSISFIVAVAIVLIVIILQIISFIQTRSKIKELCDMFDGVEDMMLKETSITSSDLRTKGTLQKFLENIPNRHVNNEFSEAKERTDYTDLSLITLSNGRRVNKRMMMIINRTNEYLCKNTGTSADLGILEDICDNQKNALEDEIHNNLNVPLYLGLAGTFIGIIVGLISVDFQEMFASSTINMKNLSDMFTSTTTNMKDLQDLIHGIVVAMIASFLGLVFTVFNSAISYKSAISKSTDGKEGYMNFLRSDLMPLLSNSMASSLNSLRGVLGHFVDKFGRNLDAYADSADLLNDNLEKQHLVLEEINKLSLTRTANKIAETFLQLKDSSDSLLIFQTYQQQLNSTIANVSGVVNQIQTLLTKFDEFSVGLSLVVSNQNKTNELQREFQNAITTHFPIGSEGRDVWRKEFDMLMYESKQVSESLSLQLKASSEHIHDFLTNNNEFFATFEKMTGVLETMVQYTQVQADCYKDLKSEILNLRKDYKDVQLESIDLHKATLKAVDAMTKAIKDINR